jgi:hypothetical protein
MDRIQGLILAIIVLAGMHGRSKIHVRWLLWEAFWGASAQIRPGRFACFSFVASAPVRPTI